MSIKLLSIRLRVLHSNLILRVSEDFLYHSVIKLFQYVLECPSYNHIRVETYSYFYLLYYKTTFQMQVHEDEVPTLPLSYELKQSLYYKKHK